MEINQDSNKDSFSFEKNTKGYNYSAKVYYRGVGTDDSEEELKARLLRYKKFLEDNFSAPNTLI